MADKNDNDVTNIESSTTETPPDDHPENQISVRSFLYSKSIIIRFVFLLIIIATFTGNTDRIGRSLMASTIEYDLNFLEDSMINVAGYAALFFGLKVVLDPLDSFEFDPGFATISVGSIKMGEALEPFTELAEDGFYFMKFSAVIIAIQIAVLKLISYLSLKIFIGAGSILCFFQYRKDSFVGRIGSMLIFTGLIVFFVYPTILHISAEAYNSFQADKAVTFSQNTGIIIEQLKDVDLEYDKTRENVELLIGTLKGGFHLIWIGFWNIVVGFILIFFITPFFSLGGLYFLSKQYLQHMEMAGAQEGLDSLASKALNSIGKRTRGNLQKNGVNQ